MYDKKTMPLRACVPVDPFEIATRDGAGERRKDGIDRERRTLRGILDFDV